MKQQKKLKHNKEGGLFGSSISHSGPPHLLCSAPSSVSQHPETLAPETQPSESERVTMAVGRRWPTYGEDNG